ncbi:MAG: tRNA lysidine(34) synthetase TilS [Alphaproteobacteria bacterium]|nr:tRNA lysidine(34) synthetase TilS [Alphaproteobacteria bacterium]
MNQNFVHFIRNYIGKRLAVAVSGGVDSVCLLHWLHEMNMDITALHVNHGLRDAADVETQYVEALCQNLGIPCQIFYWTGDKPASNLEAAARDARYNMMTQWCRENNIDALAIAHQADDQIETFLMNLARGSGVTGLAAMRGESTRDGVKIIRPLLKVYRSELQAYCDSHNIKYFHDEMNFDTQYTRVRIRQNRHLLRDALGIEDARILLAIENLGRARDALDVDINTRIGQVIDNDGAFFSCSFLFDPAPDIRLKFLGRLIQKIGGDNYQPRLKSLTGALNKLNADCKFTLGHCTLRRLGDEILIVPEGNRASFRKKHEKQKKCIK